MNKYETALRLLASKRGVLFYAQRTVLRPAAREAIADALSRVLPKASTPLDEAGQRLAQGLRSEGFAYVPELLSPGQLADVRAHFADKLVHDPYRQKLGRFHVDGDVPPETHIAHFQASDVIAAPHLLQIANRPEILASLGAIFGCKPTLSYLATWWSIAGREKPEHAELWHRDVDDWRFVKLFVYLTDVDEEAGPHVYVPKSHVADRMLKIRRYADQEVEDLFGPKNLLRYYGPAGTAFLENTFGLHRGLPPMRKNRLIFQAVYSMLPLPYAPPRPIADLQNEAFDPYVNRVYFRA